jgi:hypothetical protein
VSAIFQRPLCQMGAAYDYAFRPVLGDPEVGSGGPCDDRPHPVELLSSSAVRTPTGGLWRTFVLCPEHESQLRRFDRKLPDGSRFRSPGPTEGTR